MRHFCGSLAVLFALAGQAGATDRVAVDIELVLAADTSNSMDEEERRAQVDGYARAFRDGDVIARILGGPYGRIAVTYVEWAETQRVIVPWTLIQDPASAADFAFAVSRTLIYQRHEGTDISGALSFGAKLIQDNEFDGVRLVIDISGDGENNSAIAPDLVRDLIVRRGVTINGLPLNLVEGPQGYFEKSEEAKSFEKPSESIGAYYRDHVIGGPGAFFLVANGMADFERMIKRKLVQEIAAR